MLNSVQTNHGKQQVNFGCKNCDLIKAAFKNKLKSDHVQFLIKSVLDADHVSFLKIERADSHEVRSKKLLDSVLQDVKFFVGYTRRYLKQKF